MSHFLILQILERKGSIHWFHHPILSNILWLHWFEAVRIIYEIAGNYISDDRILIKIIGFNHTLKKILIAITYSCIFHSNLSCNIFEEFLVSCWFTNISQRRFSHLKVSFTKTILNESIFQINITRVMFGPKTLKNKKCIF